jgi:integrase/recombinase XerC
METIEAELMDVPEQPGMALATTAASETETLALALRDAGHGSGPDLGEWLQNGLSTSSREAYKRDFANFSRWLAQQIGQCEPDCEESANRLLWAWLLQGRLPGGAVAARRLVARWQQEMLANGLSAATAGRRLAALKWLSRQAALNEVVDLRLELLRSPKPEATDRDMTGVGSLLALAQLVEQAGALGNTEPERVRNRLILLLFAWNGLRRGELSRLSLADWDPATPTTLKIRGKGRTQREAITISAAAAAAMADWLAIRPSWAPQEPWAPLLVGLDQRAPHRAAQQLPLDLAAAATDLAGVQPMSPSWWERMTAATSSIRLSGTSLYRLVRLLSPQAKVLSPHRIRHSAITSAVRELNLSLADAQELARHANPATTSRYVDRKGETQAKVTNALAAAGAALVGAA